MALRHNYRLGSGSSRRLVDHARKLGSPDVAAVAWLVDQEVASASTPQSWQEAVHAYWPSLAASLIDCHWRLE